MVSEIHLVGKEDVSLKEKERATRETHPDPKTKKNYKRVLQVVQPSLVTTTSSSIRAAPLPSAAGQ